MLRWFTLALKIAEESNHPVHKVGAVLIRGGSVLATEANQHAWGRHAEMRCLRPHMDAKGTTLFIARRGTRMSRPCERFCMPAIKRAGVSKIVYAGWDNKIVIEEL